MREVEERARGEGRKEGIYTWLSLPTNMLRYGCTPNVFDNLCAPNYGEEDSASGEGVLLRSLGGAPQCYHVNCVRTSANYAAATQT